MELYTIGFTKKTAEEFFDLIRNNHIDLLADVRLNNVSQLAGFTKGHDLAFFLREICGCGYTHDVQLAPSKEILDDYKNGVIDWDTYVERFIPLIRERQAVENFLKLHDGAEKPCLLCSETTPENCHRRLIAEEIKKLRPEINVIHL